MNLETYTRAQMARFSIEEGARHGGVNNMLAVASVLRNRVFAGWGDWLEVVMAAPGRRGNVDGAAAVDWRSGNVRIFLNRLDEVYSSPEAEDITGGALFYVDPQLEVTAWFKAEVAGRPDAHPRVAHVGPVWFFK